MISWKIGRRIITGVLALGFVLVCAAGLLYVVFGRGDSTLDILRQQEQVAAQETEKVLAELDLAEQATKQLGLYVDALHEERLKLEAGIEELGAEGVNMVWQAVAQHLTRQSRALAGLQTVYLSIVMLCVLAFVGLLGFVVVIEVLPSMLRSRSDGGGRSSYPIRPAPHRKRPEASAPGRFFISPHQAVARPDELSSRSR